jgi:CheY-like chemotaxis protein
MRAAGKKVALVVEDEALIRAEVVDEFRSRGWAVVDTGSGEEAVNLASDNYFDVVFTDIKLSGPLQGWDVAERLRSSGRRIPVVYASGNAPDRSRRVAGSLFFDKPYSSEAVVRACERLVST